VPHLISRSKPMDLITTTTSSNGSSTYAPTTYTAAPGRFKSPTTKKTGGRPAPRGRSPNGERGRNHESHESDEIEQTGSPVSSSPSDRIIRGDLCDSWFLLPFLLFSIRGPHPM